MTAREAYDRDQQGNLREDLIATLVLEWIFSFPDWYSRWHFEFEGDVPIPVLAGWELREIVARVMHDATPHTEPDGPPEKALPEVATGVFDPHDLTHLEERRDGERLGGSFRPAVKRQKHAVHIIDSRTGEDLWRNLGNDVSAIRQFLESIAPGPLEEIAAPIKRGRQPPAERTRREQQARLAAAAHKRGATEEAIGSVLGGRIKQRIHDLLKLAAQLPKEPLRINSARTSDAVELVPRECEECGSTGHIIRRERLNSNTLGIERRWLCDSCNAGWKPGLRLVG